MANVYLVIKMVLRSHRFQVVKKNVNVIGSLNKILFVRREYYFLYIDLYMCRKLYCIVFIYEL